MLAVQALDHLNHQRVEEALRDGRRAVDLLTEPGIPFSTVPWTALCIFLFTSGRGEEVEDADTFLDAAQATGDDYAMATAFSTVASWLYTLGDRERCLPFAEEAMRHAEQIRNPTLMGLSGFYLGGALETSDRPRARAVLKAAIDVMAPLRDGYMIASSLVSLARLGTEAANPTWASEFRSALDVAYEAGDLRGVLMALGMYAQALATTDRVESATMLLASVGELSPHMSTPIALAHNDEAERRLRSQLDAERFAELTARGATLGYEAAVALAFAELDRVISQDNGN